MGKRIRCHVHQPKKKGIGPTHVPDISGEDPF